MHASLPVALQLSPRFSFPPHYQATHLTPDLRSSTRRPRVRFTCACAPPWLMAIMPKNCRASSLHMFSVTTFSGPYCTGLARKSQAWAELSSALNTAAQPALNQKNLSLCSACPRVSDFTQHMRTRKRLWVPGGGVDLCGLCAIAVRSRMLTSSSSPVYFIYFLSPSALISLQKRDARILLCISVDRAAILPSC